MFRPMRRSRQELTRRESDEILYAGSSGVLALSGGGWPYAVPLSYVYDGEKIYFHCAKSGHKLDAVKNDERASFCVVARDEVVPEKFTTLFKSVIVFGRVRVLENDAEKRAAIEKLARKYSPGESAESTNDEIERFWNALCMLEMSAEHVSGKQCKELVPKPEATNGTA
ncbi:MAG: pyridoxamine 5'-phosphate oxidase family protein [Butyricicoccus sp.]|nr:pyridoxamine 5'-phosphate oxidase family protein [Butyricicoccus sp.]